MPEIKRQFTGGKMNKDLDERLIPNGQYRDAMNVEVSTSEASEVGTVQNILGNINVTNSIQVATLSDGSYNYMCVGIVEDEKNDHIYWFIRPSYTSETNPNLLTGPHYILQYKVDGNAKIVFADVNENVLNFPAKTITGINIIDGMLFWTDGIGEPKKINIQRSIDGTSQNGANHTHLINTETGITSNDQIDVELKHITVIKKGPSNPLKLTFDTGRRDDVKYSGIVSVTQDPGTTENRSSVGYFPGQDDLFDFSSFEVGDEMILWIESDLDGNQDFTINGWLDDPDNLASSVKVGTQLVLKEYDDDGDGALNPIQPSVPINPTNFRIKGTIVSWTHNTTTQTATNNMAFYVPGVSGSNAWPSYLLGRACVKIRIDSINGYPPTPGGLEFGSSLKYVIDRFDDIERLYEFKFPRFSYRYKYEDGEYSTFAPWSDVIFKPGSFDHHPKKGYNLGMTNQISEVEVSDFIPSDIPLDVVAVDILYKEDTSTTIYLVETFSDKDELSSGQNNWKTNTYTITSETIKSVLPANQLLRPWDNVPKSALAQDITGNRIVYANYLQNYDLKVGGYYYNPNFNLSIHQINHPVASALPSIKSLREYQLGVVFVDEYGRETPVISNPSGTINLSKDFAITANSFHIGFTQSYPVNMTHMKFYVKEVSGEYYNMAMDRFYDAADGNVWLAFASTDRNKIDIDTFLVLKKGNTRDGFVEEPGRYKIIAIEGDAPDFIKTVELLISEKSHSLTGTVTQDLFGDDMTYAPQVGMDHFKMAYAPFHGSAGAKIHEILKNEAGVRLFIEFGLKTEASVSNRYQVTEIACDYDGPNGNTDINEAFYYVRIKGIFDDDINFISDDPTGFNSTKILDTATIRFYKYSVEHRPEFDGRFFVKIYRDGIFDTYIKPLFNDDTAEWKTITKRKVYHLHDSMHDRDFAGGAMQMFNAGLDGKQHILGLTGTTQDDYLAWGWVAKKISLNYKMTGLGFQAGIAGYETDHTSAGSPALGNPYYYGLASMTEDLLNTHGEIDKDRGYYRKSAFHAWLTEFHWDGDDLWDLYESAISGTALAVVGGQHLNPFSTYQYHLYKPGTTGQFTSQSAFESQLGGGRKLKYNGYKNYNLSKSSGGPSGNANPSEPDFEKTDTWFVHEGMYVGFNHTTLDDLAEDGHWGLDKTISSGANKRQGLESNKKKLNLSFGPIFGDFGSLNTIRNWSSIDWPIKDFFNIGSGSPHYPHQQEFSEKLNPGFQFRWKQDPEQTVYTIQADVGIHRLINYFYDPDGVNQDPITSSGDQQEAQIGDSSKDWRTLPQQEHPANYCKNFKIEIDPPMNNKWNPFHSALEPIQNNKGIKIQLNVSSTYGSQSYAWGDLDSFYVEVDTIVGEDLNYGNIARSVYPGMIITDWEYNDSGGTSSFGDSSSQKSQYLVVDEIEYDAVNEKYKLFLVGYQWPLRVYDLPGTSDPRAASNIKNKPFYPGQPMTFQQAGTNYISPQFAENWNKTQRMQPGGWSRNTLAAIGYDMEFIEPINPQEVVPDYPAIWETEPKEQPELDIYYEIGGLLPLAINKNTIDTAIPIGSTFHTSMAGWTAGVLPVIDYDSDPTITNLTTAVLERSIVLDGFNSGLANQLFSSRNSAPKGTITKPDGTTLLLPIRAVTSNMNTLNETYIIFWEDFYNTTTYKMPWYNCYSFANGVESNRIRDNFNLPFISNGVKASTTLSEQYKEEHRKSGLIYSGIYNSISGVNNLNQFIQAEKITKDINPIYGSIQKLHSRDSDLVALCEDKILKILANKDAVFNADGNPQLIATPNVLGQTVPFTGEYGISKNPESFASESYRAYFTDKQRGAVLRLSKDGLTPISDYGMKDWFKDHLRLNPDPSPNVSTRMEILGSYDSRKNEYNVKVTRPMQVEMGNSIENIYQPYVVSFKEDVKGWVSFKSFVQMEAGVSVSGNYYTVSGPSLYQHHMPDDFPFSDRNTFYGISHESTVDVVLNDNPGIVKTFNTLNYEGSQSKVKKFIQYTSDGTDANPVGTGEVYTDLNFHNLEDKQGWYINNITTDMQDGKITEFINKENKWFNYIQGIDLVVNSDGTLTQYEGQKSLSESEFSFQGLGSVSSTNVNVMMLGCTDPLYEEYDSTANVDDGSCSTLHEFGCMNDSATNYDPNATSDDGSCIIEGCTDSTAFNYNSDANTDDGSCTPIVLGCISEPVIPFSGTDINGQNLYGLSVGYQDTDGYCAPPDDSIQGVIGPLQGWLWNNCNNAGTPSNPVTGYKHANHNPNANTNDGSCWEPSYGCTDASASNHDITAKAPNPQYGTVIHPDTGQPVCNYDGCTDPTAYNYDANANNNVGCCFISGCMISGNSNYDASDPACADCSGIYNGTDDSCCVACIYGCTDSLANNYDSAATCDDGTCTYTTGCTDANAYNYVPSAVQDDGSCCFIAGCMNNTMFNYDVTACFDDGSCEPFIYGCTDAAAFNYDSAANTDNGSCIPIALGCIDNAACNYDSLANTDDNSCCYDSGSGCTGCTDSTADNYDPNVCEDDGSCTYAGTIGCGTATSNYISGQGYWPDNVNGEDMLGNSCNTPTTSTVDGFTIYSGGCWTGTANIDNGLGPNTGQPLGYKAKNYNPNAANNGAGGLCEYEYGCADSLAYNYSAYVVQDPNNPNVCVPIIYGCLTETYTDTNGDTWHNYNIGSGPIGGSGNPPNTQPFRQFPVTATGDPMFDVNTHTQEACIPYSDPSDYSAGPAGCTEDANGSMNNGGVVYSQRYVVPNNTVNPTNEGPYTFVDIEVMASTNWLLQPFEVTGTNYDYPYNYNESYTTIQDNFDATGEYDPQEIFEVDIMLNNSSFEWDPANQNVCCNVGGCLHPWALNFDAKGFRRWDPKEVKHGLYGNGQPSPYPVPQYIGIGNQDDPVQYFYPPANMPYAIPGQEPTRSGSGKACTACPGAHWDGPTGSPFEGAPPFNNGNFARFFKEVENPDGTIDFVPRDIPWNGQTWELTNNNVLGVFDVDASGASSYDPSTSLSAPGTRNPWNWAHPAHQCCAFNGYRFPYNQMNPTTGCTNPNACYVDPWNSDLIGFSSYCPTCNWDNGTCCTGGNCDANGDCVGDGGLGGGSA